ncbi:Pfs NACHT and ankyrin domain protein [Penicillium verhagenii]|uniref:Pfs NACHT and ankyrin domain protein n=1 Tax=Penicillium verhagenii TaxID=1562060 RepID=UPI00254596C3|nr:Pfs NACHT and ankyrin domain protein [Penicillium verhagenii]KAJ5938397.1 Pfs NACHT and ankyrin domain protein [Penicillium verhagenii]
MFEGIDTQKLNIKTARFGTGEWLLANPDYQEWLHSAPSPQTPRVLGINGKPGAGKSMIMKFAYLNAKRGTGNQHVVAASFFFNKEGGYLKRSIVGLHRSLLLQLLEGCPDIQIMMDDSTMASLSHGGCPSLHVLKHLFCQAVFALGQRSFLCFIDALDVCDEREAADLMQYFDNLTKLSTAAGSLFRVCVSGGDGLSMSHRFRTRIILEDQSGHVKDLESTIARRLHAGTSTLVEGLHSKLLQKAAGNFKWVLSVVDDINTEVARGEMCLGRVLKNAGLI